MSSNEEKILRNYYGENYDKAMKTGNTARKKLIEKFKENNPYADINKFDFSVVVNKSGNLESSNIFYIIDDNESTDITSEQFTSNKLWSSYLGWPSPWGVNGTVQNFKFEADQSLNVTKMKIFVTNDSFFWGEFDDLDIKNNDSDTDYKTNSYLTALYAAYVSTYLCGISTKHFKYKPSVPKIVTSIARYHLYYQMSRFLHDPRKLKIYVNNNVVKIINDNKPVKSIWEKKFHQGSEQLGTFLAKFPRGTVRNVKPEFSHYGGQVGIRYEQEIRKTIGNLKDYLGFIATGSDGLTKTGELLFQQSIESFVYCVLGAQADTRWPIVGSGARSLQTQEVFKKLVGDTIVQDDHTVILRNMRAAIKSTNVILKTAVSPGIILVPSNMIILDKMIAGYNNVLTIAGKGMKFGYNENVNYFVHKNIDHPDVVRKIIENKKKEVISGHVPINMTDFVIFGSMGVAGAAITWMFL